MVVQPGLPAALTAAACGANGLSFDQITGVTWKGFTTATKVADKGKVGTSAVVDVLLSAKTTATTGQRDAVIGVTGRWVDDGDGVVESPPADLYFCTGIATSSVYVAAP
jgi:hypothetical protein